MITIDINEYKKLQRRVDDAQRTHDQAQAKVENLTDTLREDHGVKGKTPADVLKVAKKKLDSLQEQGEKLATALEVESEKITTLLEEVEEG